MKKFTFIRFIEPAEREEIGIGHYGEGEQELGVSRRLERLEHPRGAGGAGKPLPNLQLAQVEGREDGGE